ncbi:MAG: PEP-CTERM sorting domain-containing protein [Akkermansiaceae bacterium]
MKKIALLIGLIFIGAIHSASAQITWNGGASGTWDTSATNWDTALTNPWATAVNTARFNTSGAAVTVSGTVHVIGLTASENATLTGGTIRTRTNGVATLAIPGGRTLSLNGTYDQSGAGANSTVVSNGGTLALASTSVFTATNLAVRQGSRIDQGGGTLTVAGTTLLGVTNGDGTHNLTGGTLDAGGLMTMGSLNTSNNTTILVGTLNVNGQSVVAKLRGGLLLGGAGTITAGDATSTRNTLKLQRGELQLNGSITSGSNWSGLTGRGGLIELGSAAGTATLRPLSGDISIGSATAENNYITFTLKGGNGVISSLDTTNVGRVVNLYTAIGQEGTQGLKFEGSGTTKLHAVNTYTGATDLSAGTLLVNGSLASTGAVSVAGGARLGGTGSVGAVTVAANGIIGAGEGIGRLTAQSLTLLQGARHEMQLSFDSLTGSGVAGTNWDQVAVTGLFDTSALSADGITLVLSTDSTSGWEWDPDESYAWTSFMTFGSASENLAGGLFTIDSTALGGSGAWSVNQNGSSLDLFYTAIPEPSHVALLTLGLVSLLAMRRREGPGVKQALGGPPIITEP